MILHAGLIAWRLVGRWRGALILGPSGSGKSDLALRALADGFALVADDRTLVFVSDRRLFGRSPAPLHGLIEARGVGILRQSALPFAPISLIVRCKAARDGVERLPEPMTGTLLGIEAPALDLWPFEISAPAKIRHAIEHLGGLG